MPFCLKKLICLHHALVKGEYHGGRAGKIQILKREDEEFKEAMEAEVSTSLSSKLSKQKERSNSGKTHVIAHFTLKFLNFLLIDILFHSYSNNIILF